MALRQTFESVITAVREECGLSSATSRGIDQINRIKQLIKRHYNQLAEDYTWQHLKITRGSTESRKVLAAGQRYYDFPTAMNPQKIERAWVKWGSTWEQMEYGISVEDYSAFDPDADQRSDPAMRWNYYNGDQFEVWPTPASNGVANGNNEIAFDGQKAVTPLVQDSDRLDMDDILVTLMVAAELLSTTDKQGAQVKGDMAVARLNTLKYNMGTKERFIMGGASQNNGFWPKHPTYIRSSS